MNKMYQTELITQIHKEIKEGTFPRFSLFCGQYGDEKNMFASMIARAFDCTLVELPDYKADTVRSLINECYSRTGMLVVAMNDIEDMSTQAKNALLKVTEEPPNHVYFVMTTNDYQSILDTIRSRATLYHLDHYSYQDLKHYCETVHNLDEYDINNLFNFCETPGDIDIIVKYGPTKFWDYVNKVVDNIATVSGSNAFKIADSIQFKDADADKYDLRLFWECFSAVCAEKHFSKGTLVTLHYLKALRTKAINKTMLFDMWILEIRREWMNGSC